MAYKRITKGTAMVGSLQVDTGGTIKIGSVELAGAEISQLDGVVAGTVTASKAVVVGANKNLDTLAIADGGLKLGSGAGTAVTSTAAELNNLDGPVAGTVSASKAVVVGANKEIDTIALPVSGLKIGTGAGTAVDATALELNETPKLPSSASTITPGSGGAATQTAAIQLKDADGNNLAGVRQVDVYMATDAAGAAPSVAGANAGVTATVGAVLKAITAALHLALVTDVNGAATLSFDNTGGGGAYTDRVVLVLPAGQGVVVSDALNVATA